MNYKDSIQKIYDLDWSKANPLRIIGQALFFAREFSSTVRACEYGHILNFQKFIAGEINTDNLQYADYKKRGDHYEFLQHFFKRKDIEDEYDRIYYEKYHNDKPFIWEERDKKSRYEQFMFHSLPDEKFATIVSREKELHGIFEKLLVAHDWDKLNLGFYKYFLERHIELDSADGGHEDLTSRLIDLTDYKDVLDQFWLARWNVYETLITK